MGETSEHDDLTPLRRENPIDSDAILTSSVIRVHSRVLKAISKGPSEGEGRIPVVGRSLWVGGGSLFAGVAVVALIASLGGPNNQVGMDARGATATPVDTRGLSSCVTVFTPTGLAARSYAFDGTVVATTGDHVEFVVNEWFRGAKASSSELRVTPGLGGAQTDDEGSPAMVIGQRYLVAGDGGFVWGCGYTQPYTQTGAAAWRVALKP